MSFDKAYPNRKDRRKSYKGGKAFSRSCRVGGPCGWCSSGRKHPSKRREPADLKEQIKGENG